jgi:hypothetical protein
MISESPNLEIVTPAGRFRAEGSAITCSIASPSGALPTRSASIATRRHRMQ